MNWVLITVALILFVGFMVGIYRGAVRIAVSLLTTVLTLVIVAFAAPYVADLLARATPLDDMIKDKVSSAIVEAAQEQLGEEQSEKLKELGISEELPENAAGEENLNIEIPQDLQQQAILESDLPGVFQSLLTENNNEVIYEELGVNSFADYAGSFLARLILNIAAFLCTFLIVTIILRAIIFALDFIAELPGLGILNHLAGGAVGFVSALIVVWLLFVFATLFYTTAIGKDVFDAIQAEPVLQMIYDNNPIMKLAAKI